MRKGLVMRTAFLLATAMTLSFAGAAAAQVTLDEDRFKPRVYGNLGVTPAYQSGTVEIFQPEDTQTPYRIIEPVESYIDVTPTSQNTEDPLQAEADRIRAYRSATAPSGAISGAYEMDLYEPTEYETVPAETTYAAPIASYPVTQTQHTVVKEDTLYNISKRYGTTVAAIQDENGLFSTNINLGQSLRIPSSTISTQSLNTTMKQPIFASAPVQDDYVTRRVVQPAVTYSAPSAYAVLKSDTIYGISRRTCVSPADLIATNGLANPNQLKPGQMLTLPSGHCLTK